MDVAIAGGGLIGLASALELAGRGLEVTVVDAGDPGQASWAAAGILGPQSEAHEPSPLVELCTKSYELYPQFVQKLQADVGFRQNGTLHLAFTEAEVEALEQRLTGGEVEDGITEKFQALVITPCKTAVCEGKDHQFLVLEGVAELTLETA